MKSTLTLLAILTLCLGAAHASDRFAVYALIDKVVLEPNPDNPERIQVSGVFSMAKANDRNDYDAPQRGYLYFKLPDGKEDLARKEWKDLKSVAGTRQVVSFGSRYQLKARVRPADEKRDAPDIYPHETGVVRVRSDTDYPPVKALLEASRR